MDLDQHNAELCQQISAEGRPTYGTACETERFRNCHRLAVIALLFGDAPEGTVLVQGIERDPDVGFPREHSWLELPDGITWDAVTCLPVGQVDLEAARFTREDVLWLVQETGMCGMYVTITMAGWMKVLSE